MSEFKTILTEHLDLARRLDVPALQSHFDRAIAITREALSHRLPVLVCGNGGSAADAQHIAGELVGKFLKQRRAFNVQCLSSNSSVLTAWGNDVSYETVFSRQVEAYGAKDGVLWAISTSGRSPNVVRAAEAARKLGMRVISFTGAGGGVLGPVSDVLLATPTESTPRVQEFHILFYHYLCERIEADLSRE